MATSQSRDTSAVETQFPQSRFLDLRPLNGPHLSVHTNPGSQLSLQFRRSIQWFRDIDIQSRPWLGWLWTYAVVQVTFYLCRYLALKALVVMYGTSDDYRMVTKLLALGLGLLEDFVCTTYFVCALWVFDTLKHEAIQRVEKTSGVAFVAQLATFVVSWLLFVIITAPFIADTILVLYRDMRFTLGLLVTIWNERHFLNDAPISSEEIQVIYRTGAFVVFIATLFALVRVQTPWSDLTLWNPMLIDMNSMHSGSTAAGTHGTQYQSVALEEGAEDDAHKLITRPSKLILPQTRTYRVAVVLLGLVVIPAFAVVLCCVCSPLVAYAALNVTLNELLLHQFEPTSVKVDFELHENGKPWVESFIDPAEEYQPFGSNTLFRRTTGFRGDLAFNVSIDRKNPPNVVVIGIESFRYRDSRYLVGQEDPSNLFKGTNLTITPHFDKWAKRGVALRNIWSSIPTSRSLESLLFGQVPYHSKTSTGITGGKADVKLSGLPQLFSKKGYETYFTTGSSITFDAWNHFLPAHGYEHVWNVDTMKDLAESKLHISRDDWSGKARRGFGWGVHDDVTFELLGDLLVEKQSMQQEQVAQGRVKVPTFITHYTISSHEPFESWPQWYSEAPKPDFSALFKGATRARRIERYMKVRYFTDMELGKFLDRMERTGILNDTIIVLVGDHGQAPEVALVNQHEESVTRVPAAIIAEGRLGEAVGLVLDDAAEQYDLLNTLADITGVPEGGFEQSGVGRSVKRSLPFGRRPVFTNDPVRKMAVVRGHHRLRYDAVTDVMMVHDTEGDYHMRTDLLPRLLPDDRAAWDKLRADGRRIAAYYKQRWDGKCLLAVKCTN